MPGAKNRKLCWNCEGSVHVHATKCPYCGTDLSTENASTPTYSYGRQPDMQPPSYDALPPSPSEMPAPIEEARPQKQPREFLPMLLMLPGAFFLLFGMILLLFSNDGTLTLEWNAHYWFFYLLLSVPLIYYGWRTLGRRKVSPEAVKIKVEENEPPQFWQ